MSIDAMKQALEALEECTAYTSSESWSPSMTRECEAAITALRAAIEQTQEPITDDHGQALRPQYRVIEKRGKWVLLYDQRQSGEVVRHEFGIQKLQHDIVLYPGITLTEAQKRFREKVEADNE